jgi:hypothetical protein
MTVLRLAVSPPSVHGRLGILGCRQGAAYAVFGSAHALADSRQID